MYERRALLAERRALLAEQASTRAVASLSQGSHGTCAARSAAAQEAQPRKRRRQLDNLPDLTAPMRGFGWDQDCPRLEMRFPYVSKKI